MVSLLRTLAEQVVYPILDLDTCHKTERDPFDVIAQWQELGLRLYQLRAKGLQTLPYADLAAKLRRAFPEMRIIANDMVDAVINDPEQFYGLHLGQSDVAGLSDARRARLLHLRAGRSSFLLGTSTHNLNQLSAALNQRPDVLNDLRALPGDIANTRKNAQLPWDYVALGPCYPTHSKPTGMDPVITIEEIRFILMEAAHQLQGKTLVFIGGLTRARIAELLAVLKGLRKTGSTDTIQPVFALIGAAMDATELRKILIQCASYSD
ncbi:MAG: thiamine phosphate synthase [Leptospiraceae bacterium]|nr:thiamine phosphate synthase [Leptospiraceae bacterium]